MRASKQNLKWRKRVWILLKNGFIIALFIFVVFGLLSLINGCATHVQVSTGAGKHGTAAAAAMAAREAWPSYPESGGSMFSRSEKSVNGRPARD